MKDLIIIFDIDGTLLDSQQDIILAVNNMRRIRGMEALPTKTLRYAAHYSLQMLLYTAFHYKTDQEFDLLCTEFKGHFDEVQFQHSLLYPHTLDILTKINDRKIPWGMATGKDEKRTLNFIHHFGIHGYTALACREHYQNSKPEPDCILLAMQQLQVSPESHMVWYIGNLKTDILAAHKAHTLSAYASWGGFEEFTETEKPPTKIFKSILDVETLWLS